MKKLLLMLVFVVGAVSADDCGSYYATADVSAQGLWCKDPTLGLNLIAKARHTLFATCSAKRSADASIYWPGSQQGEVAHESPWKAPPDGKVSAAWILSLEITGDMSARYKREFDESSARKAEVHVDIDGRIADMTLEEFKRRVFEDTCPMGAQGCQSNIFHYGDAP